jgi:hypothetical protein
MTSFPGNETTALHLLEEALHLHVNGERAPGGGETWSQWERRVEEFLRTERRRQFRASLRSSWRGDPYCTGDHSGDDAAEATSAAREGEAHG